MTDHHPTEGDNYSGVPSTEFVLYQTDDGLARVEVRASGETVWLSLDQMAELFQRDKSTISRHLTNVFSEGELERKGTVADFATVQTEGHRTVTRQVTYYDLDVIIGALPRKAEVAIAKNYLSEDELKKLNSLVSAYFDAAEFRAQSHEPTYMKDWLAHLDRLIAAMNAPILMDSGSVSHRQAAVKAEGEYDAYRRRIVDEPTPVEVDYLESLKAAQRRIEPGPRGDS